MRSPLVLRSIRLKILSSWMYAPRESIPTVISVTHSTSIITNPRLKMKSRSWIEKTYFVYCQAGGRSKSAYEIMKKEGFNNVYELNGGISEWQSSNLPITVKPD